MADPIHDMLTPYFHALDTSSRPIVTDNTTTRYLNYLTGLSLSDLSTSESGSLLQHSHTLIRSLQSLSKRSHKSIISSVTHLSNLSSSLLPLLKSSEELQASVPKVESSAVNFTDKYRRATDIEDEVLTRRRKALLLSNNGDRISSILDLPTLLSTAISSASQPASTSSSVNHASALDLHAHIKRLSTLYPQSPLVSSISTQAEHEMKLLTTNLITSLQNQNVKLAGAMRTIGWLRRVAPELDESIQLDRQWGKRNIKSYLGNTEGALGALFLVARLKNLINMLDALEPLRDLADQETRQRQRSNNIKRASLPDDRSAVGQQTERYLKRYIEIFREQSFAIVTMYKSIFPSALPAPGSDTLDDVNAAPWSTCSDRLLLPLPSSLATFPSHLVDMLFETLRKYLPNVNDRASRDSLMTQVLYCAGSLGRLGGDFSMMLAFLEDDGIESDEEQILDTEFEWVEVTKKHRIQASKLELLASGVGTGKRAT
jgi:hypothetical protein